MPRALVTASLRSVCSTSEPIVSPAEEVGGVDALVAVSGAGPLVRALSADLRLIVDVDGEWEEEDEELVLGDDKTDNFSSSFGSLLVLELDCFREPVSDAFVRSFLPSSRCSFS